ncbi:MAG: hypothetical protein M0Z33_10235 [Actinomycetota bacterium]|nr:hypothetical protein [Actinomycetota bacterium]
MASPSAGRAVRKGVLLRLDPAVHDAISRWASEELRSTNAQIEFVLRRALRDEGRTPPDRPRSHPTTGGDGGAAP